MSKNQLAEHHSFTLQRLKLNFVVLSEIDGSQKKELKTSFGRLGNTTAEYLPFAHLLFFLSIFFLMMSRDTSAVATPGHHQGVAETSLPGLPCDYTHTEVVQFLSFHGDREILMAQNISNNMKFTYRVSDVHKFDLFMLRKTLFKDFIVSA